MTLNEEAPIGWLYADEGPAWFMDTKEKIISSWGGDPVKDRWNSVTHKRLREEAERKFREMFGKRMDVTSENLRKCSAAGLYVLPDLEGGLPEAVDKGLRTEVQAQRSVALKPHRKRKAENDNKRYDDPTRETDLPDLYAIAQREGQIAAANYLEAIGE